MNALFRGLPAVCWLLVGGTLWADVIEVQLPALRSRKPIVLVGKVEAHAGGSATFTHPKLGKLYMDVGNYRVHKAKTPQELFQSELAKARKSGSANNLMKAAIFALHKGMLDDFYKTVEEVLKVDPQHADARRVINLRDEVFRKPVTKDIEEQKNYMRQKVRNRNMKFKQSEHFLLMHDTPDALPKDDLRKVPRAESRLRLLEQVYETFLLKFYAQGVELDIPDERLMVVLFDKHKDYLEFATALDPDLQSASGFYIDTVNISFFFDHGTMFPELKEELQKLERDKQDAIRNKDGQFVRAVNMLKFLVTLDSENSDISVVSHECTHQMAANTGLFPRHVRVPSWVHEGLATYFESPGEATWAGIGAANEERLTFYRMLANQRDVSNIDFVVSDKIFRHAASLGATLHGYAQCWALTHYLMENHFDKLMTYYRRIGEFPPGTLLSPEVLTEVFHEVFKEEMAHLDSDWHAYMNSLRTDLERIRGE